MGIVIANALSGYLETLYEMNQRLVGLCGIDIMKDSIMGEKMLLDLIQDIPRMIPYSYNRKIKALKYNKKDGLLEFTEELPYLSMDYDDILHNNYEFLDKIRKIRNKYEHKMHGAEYCSSGGGTMILFEFTFKVEDEFITVTSVEFISTMKMLNSLFDKIVADVRQYAQDVGKMDYPYYQKLCKHDFRDFNNVYDSDLIKTIGRILKGY